KNEENGAGTSIKVSGVSRYFRITANSIKPDSRKTGRCGVFDQTRHSWRIGDNLPRMVAVPAPVIHSHDVVAVCFHGFGVKICTQAVGNRKTGWQIAMNMG